MGQRDNIRNCDGNLEALRRYENECDENERIYESKLQSMFSELEDVIETYIEIANRYDLLDEAKEFIEDRL